LKSEYFLNPIISVPEREFEVRKDLRNERIFTIDPKSSKDLDDALSIALNEDGSYDVGVHIADVSHFVRPNTALDRDARKRATSVYLVQRAVPMLPPTLSEQLCSLVPAQDRLALSVIFTLTKEAKIVKKWFGKTVIRFVLSRQLCPNSTHFYFRSAAKLSYGDAQDVIDGKTLGGILVTPGHDTADIAHDIKILHNLAQQLRAQRMENGALCIDSMELSFKLDDNGFPEDCWQYEKIEANHLVEEVCLITCCDELILIEWAQFMLLSNTAVAQHIAVHLPEQALLRRHDTPIDRRLVRLIFHLRIPISYILHRTLLLSVLNGLDTN
jgi:protein SSD1